jgi:HAD superfamily hydrolase (TIGR01509 family)
MTDPNRADPGRITAARFDAVLFDLDGVLIDSQEAWFHVLNAAARELGHPPIPREAFEPTFGQGVEADAEQFFPGTPVPEIEAYFETRFLDHARHVVVDPDAQPVMRALAQRGMPTAVVTNTQDALARETVRGAGLEPDRVVGVRPGLQSKPAPDLVLHACRALGVAPERALMVGDSRFDQEAARAAGAPFLACRFEAEPRIERLSSLLLHLDD